jgi:hypothetical protein
MKTKEFSKKLTLKKGTIAHLGNKKLNEVRGGVDTMPQPCVSYPVCIASRLPRLTCDCL